MFRRFVIVAALMWTACPTFVFAAEPENDQVANTASDARRESSVLTAPPRRRQLVNITEVSKERAVGKTADTQGSDIRDALDAIDNRLSSISQRVTSLERLWSTGQARSPISLQPGQGHAPSANAPGWFVVDNQRAAWQSLTVNGSEWSVPPGQSYIPVRYGVVVVHLTHFEKTPKRWNHWRWNDRQACFEIGSVIR